MIGDNGWCAPCSGELHSCLPVDRRCPCLASSCQTLRRCAAADRVQTQWNAPCAGGLHPLKQPNRAQIQSGNKKASMGEKVGASRWDAKQAPKCKGGRHMVCQQEKCTMHTTLSLIPKLQLEVPLATSASRLSRPATCSSTRSTGDTDCRASWQPSDPPSGTGPGLLPFSCRSS